MFSSAQVESSQKVFADNIELTECHTVTQLLRRSDTFFGECCGFCVIERLSCQMAGTNGPKKIES